MADLRPYQTDVIDRVRAAAAAGKQRILLVAPTGSGKTIIGASIIKLSQDYDTRVLFLAHRRELITQASSKLHDQGLDHGIGSRWPVSRRCGPEPFAAPRWTNRRPS